MVDAALKLFPEDGGIILIPLRGHDMVTLSRPVVDNGNYALEIFTGDDYIEVPLTPRRFEMRVGTGPNWGGLLVTFLKANAGAMASAANEEFDKAISAYGEILKPTSCQNHRGTTVMNGNRYCVLAPGEKTVPSTIVVFNHLNC